MREGEKIAVIVAILGIGLALCMGIFTIIAPEKSQNGNVTEKEEKGSTSALTLLINVRPTLLVTAMFYMVAEFLVLSYLVWPRSCTYQVSFLTASIASFSTFVLISYFAFRFWLLR